MVKRMRIEGLEGVKWIEEGQDLILGIDGKLDTMRAMSLDEQLSSLSEDIINIIFDLDGLEYIASAGLRILYWAQEYTEEKGGKMTVKNVSPEVDDIFEMTGFKDMINIE
jgi:anti-anti-sigma factor